MFLNNKACARIFHRKQVGRYALRKILLLLGILLIASTSAFAAKIPDEVKDYIYQEVPNSYVRFDGVIILPDNTVYLPLYPSLFSDINNLQIKETIPAGQNLSQKPDVVIFNNDFVMLKVIPVEDGKKTVLNMQTPPLITTLLKTSPTL